MAFPYWQCRTDESKTIYASKCAICMWHGGEWARARPNIDRARCAYYATRQPIGWKAQPRKEEKQITRFNTAQCLPFVAACNRKQNCTACKCIFCFTRAHYSPSAIHIQSLCGLHLTAHRRPIVACSCCSLSPFCFTSSNLIAAFCWYRRTANKLIELKLNKRREHRLEIMHQLLLHNLFASLTRSGARPTQERRPNEERPHRYGNIFVIIHH